ncbi:MAG TPA: cyclase family protein [Actinomycetota bacterium]|nr:cyclase family protein [Actinomycetota bacterium]
MRALRRSSLSATTAAVGLLGFVAGAVLSFALTGRADVADRASQSGRRVAHFDHVVYLSHLNNPHATPGFPGDPKFRLSTAFTVPQDGFYLQFVREGEHTGTHWGAPCHFHVGAACAGALGPASLVLPAAVIDIRANVRRNVDYRLRVSDIKSWIAHHGPLPHGAAVIARTGCSKFWGPSTAPHGKTYYNCGSRRRGLHQPGFSLRAVRWLIRHHVLANHGALGTDTFGPDPGTDANFRESSLVFHRHRIDLENLTHVGRLPARGAWVVVGGPRNLHGSGSPATIFGLVP